MRVNPCSGRSTESGGGGTERTAQDAETDPKTSPDLHNPRRPADPASRNAPEPEAPWLAQLDKAGIPRMLTYPGTTLGRLLDQSAERFPDAPALAYGEARWTYRELLSQVNRLAGGLASLGVRRGDRVLMVLPNCPEYVTTFFAVQKLGAVLVNAGPLMGVDDLRAVVAMTTPRVAVGLDLQAGPLARVADHSTLEHWVWVSLRGYQPAFKRLGYRLKLWQSHGHNGKGEKNGKAAKHEPHHNGNGNGHGVNGSKESKPAVEHVLLADLLARAPSRPPTVEPDPSRVAVLQPTGGTTGTLKLAELTHRGLLANATQVCVWEGCRAGQERILAVLPMFHVYGLTTCLVTGIYSAAELILTTRFVVAETLGLLREHRPTIFPVVPAICEALSDRLEKEQPPTPLAELRLCFSGAAPLSRATAERFERLSGAKLVEGYGLTEASPVTHANLPGAARFGSIGLPMPDTRVRLAELDDPAKDVKPGEPGEMLVSGPQVMRGYFANPEQTERALFTDDRGEVWLRTGDVARCDADGYFYVIDRRKDMVIRSGLKVYPGKVEKVLATHPKVAEAAVVGRPHAVHTETVVAVVAMKAGAPEKPAETEALVSELKALCREHLAPYEVPEAFEFLEKLPRSALGKLLKRELRAWPAGSGPEAGANGNGHAGNGNGMAGSGNGAAGNGAIKLSPAPDAAPVTAGHAGPGGPARLPS